MTEDQREIHRKLRILEHGDEIGSVAIFCRFFGSGRSRFYRWRDAFRLRRHFPEREKNEWKPVISSISCITAISNAITELRKCPGTWTTGRDPATPNRPSSYFPRCLLLRRLIPPADAKWPMRMRSALRSSAVWLKRLRSTITPVDFTPLQPWARSQRLQQLPGCSSLMKQRPLMPCLWRRRRLSVRRCRRLFRPDGFGDRTDVRHRLQQAWPPLGAGAIRCFAEALAVVQLHPPADDGSA